MINQAQCNIIALTMISGLSPKKILGFSKDRLFGNIDPGPVKRSKEYLEELEYIEEEGITPVSYWDDSYPGALRDIHDPPVILYCKGAFRKDDVRSVAIVGSRRCSAYGLQMAERLAFELAQRGITIVSGMARGIDTAAHMGALKAGGRTIAVMGSGFRHIYPAGSEKLVQQILSNGVVVTEFDSRKEPFKYNFPRRNRIVSGLSQGVVVVEASQKSGALITADFALDEGKEVFAVPGRADSYVSRGTNDLIRTGAKIVTCAEDILEELRSITDAPRCEADTPKTLFPEAEIKNDSGLPEDHLRVIKAFKVDVPLHIDEIWENVEVDRGVLSEILLTLELKKFIKTLPGSNYVLCREK